MRHLLRVVLILAVGSLSLKAQECDFECTVKKHLDAIRSQDFQSFAETITANDSLDFILPNGKSFTSRATYLELIKGWFEESGWHFDYKVVRKITGADFGTVLLRVTYREDDRDGQPYRIEHFLYLVFQKQQGEWKLIHDQNTKIE